MSQADFPTMKRYATGAFLFCLVGMVVCRIYESELPGLAWGRAFFEAATVGALADWFAVVALFRHPAGIPIWHTAIMPNNKDRVADSLAGFIEDSFLTEAQLGPRFRSIDYAGLGAEWLKRHSDFLATKAADFAPGVLAGVNDEEISTLLAERARHLIRSEQLGPVAAEGLLLAMSDGRDRQIFVSLLESTRQMIEEHRPMIQAKIREEIPLSAESLGNLPFLRNFAGSALEQLRDGLAGMVATRTIEKIQATLNEAATEPDHALWQSFDRRFRQFVEELKSSPELSAKVMALQGKFADSGTVDDFAARAWKEVRAFLEKDCASPESMVREKLRSAIESAAAQLADNPKTRSDFNEFFGEQVVKVVLASKTRARELVVSTVENWDPKEMSDRLESVVGADLQFIRINGTIVGGMVGVTIHAAFWIFGM